MFNDGSLKLKQLASNSGTMKITQALSENYVNKSLISTLSVESVCTCW